GEPGSLTPAMNRCSAELSRGASTTAPVTVEAPATGPRARAPCGTRGAAAICLTPGEPEAAAEATTTTSATSSSPGRPTFVKRRITLSPLLVGGRPPGPAHVCHWPRLNIPTSSPGPRGAGAYITGCAGASTTGLANRRLARRRIGLG